MPKVSFHILIILASLAGMSCESTPKTKYDGHGVDSLPQEVLDKHAPKPVDPQELARIQMMLDVRSPYSAVLTPNGQRMVFGWSVTGVGQIWRIDGPNQFPVQMTGGQESSRLIGITRDGKSLIISRDQGGDEYPGIYLQDIEGGALQEIYYQKKVQARVSHLTEEALYFVANDREPSTYDVYRYTFSNQRLDKIFVAPRKGAWRLTDRLDDGTLLLTLWTGSFSNELYLAKEGSDQLTPVLGQGEVQYYVASFGRNSSELIVQTDKFDEFDRLYRLRANFGKTEVEAYKWSPITPERPIEVAYFRLDKPRKKILVSINDRGYTSVEAYRLSNGRPMKVPKFKGDKLLQLNFGSTTPNGRYTAFRATYSDQPSEYRIYDWRTGRSRSWLKGSAPEIDTRTFHTPSLEHYVARDGTKIPMFVWRPKQCVKTTCPVVVNFHGGPESQARPYFSPMTELYLEQGYIYVRPNVRGSSGYGKTWVHSDNGPRRLDVITDIEDASIYIKKNWSFDGVTPKIAVMGGSYGGYSTFYAMTRFAGAYDAGVAIVGMSSLITFLNNTAAYRRALRVSEYGDPEKDLEALKKLSPITYVNQISDPLMIIHGASDPRVPAGEAVQIYEVMEQKGLKGELLLFADEGHGIRKRKNQAVYFAHIFRFLKTHLQ